MIVFENGEKLRGSASDSRKSAFCKTMEYRGAGQDRQQKSAFLKNQNRQRSRKRSFEKHRKSADDQEFSRVKR